MRIRLSLVLCLFGLGSFVSAADRTDFKVNDDIGTAEQSTPKVAIAPDGKFTVVWVDKQLGNSDIYLQRFDSSGQPIGSNLRLNTDAQTAHQAEVSIANDLAGNLAAVWTDYREGSYPFSPDIFLQQLTGAGLPAGSNAKVTIELPDTLKANPDISIGPFGGVVVWSDFRSGHWDVYLQRYDASGSLSGANLRVNDDLGVSQQHSPRVSVSPDGWCVVTWYDTRTGSDDIYAQLFSASGSKRGGNVRVHSDPTINRQAFPDVAADGAGHFTIVWTDWRNGIYPANPDIYARRFDTLWQPLTGEYRINTDAGQTAQRDVAISADRRGNVAVVWSDSTAGSFDISGQMIDVDGRVRVVNFKANATTDSMQVKPDVALDGRKRVTVWSDRRAGSWDIFAAISTYNSPSLTASPPVLQFTMLEGGTLPAPQAVAIDHVGYNTLSFTASSAANWLSVPSASGATPETLLVRITAAQLAAGTYNSRIQLIDTDNSDSSLSIPVTLTVSRPVLQVSADSLYCRLLRAIKTTDTVACQIRPSALANFNWTATADSGFIELLDPVGTGGDSCRIAIDVGDRPAGDYRALVSITASAGVDSSPRLIPVVVTVEENLPYLQIEPDSIVVVTTDSAQIIPPIPVRNLGGGSLQWELANLPNWLAADSVAAGDSLSLSCSLQGRPFGMYRSLLVISDSAAFNTADTLLVVVVYAKSSDDSIRIVPAQIETNGFGSIGLLATVFNSYSFISLPIAADTNWLKIDSVTRGSSPIGSAVVTAVDSVGYLCELRLDSAASAGEEHLLAELAVTAGSFEGSVSIGESFDPLRRPYGLKQDSTPVLLHVLADTVRISLSTSVTTDSSFLPAQFQMGQNFPNPCNPSTVIEFDLPRIAPVELELFNLLGQRVIRLVEETLPPGRHRVIWDGLDRTGQPVASGVYLYRLQAGEQMATRKLLLLR